MKIKYTIKRIRLEKKLSQEQLAKLAQISIGTLVRIEQNKTNTNFVNIVSIAKVLEVSIYDLFEIIF